MKFQFTQAAVKAWGETAKPGELAWDSVQRGLCCYVTSSGVSLMGVWRVGRTQRKKVLFRLHEGSIQQARTMAAEWLTAGRHGRDVLQDQQRASQRALTLSDAYSSYVDALVRRGSSPLTLKLHECNYRLRLAKWGSRPLASFSRQECRDLHNSWRRAGAGPAGSNNTARLLKSVFSHALRKLETDLTFNPATAIEMFEQRNLRKTLSLTDLPRWGEAVGRMTNVNRRCLWLLICFTGLRRTDACSIKVADIHWDRAMLRRGSPKGGPKRAFDVPLSTQVRAILEQAIDAKQMIAPDSPYLFPAVHRDGPYACANHDEVLGVGCHSLRRFFASACIHSGVELIYTKSLLGHSTSGDVTLNSYVQLSPVKRLEAMQKASDWIEARLTELGTRSGAPVGLLEFQPVEAAER